MIFFLLQQEAHLSINHRTRTLIELRLTLSVIQRRIFIPLSVTKQIFSPSLLFCMRWCMCVCVCVCKHICGIWISSRSGCGIFSGIFKTISRVEKKYTDKYFQQNYTSNSVEINQMQEHENLFFPSPTLHWIEIA